MQVQKKQIKRNKPSESINVERTNSNKRQRVYSEEERRKFFYILDERKCTIVEAAAASSVGYDTATSWVRARERGSAKEIFLSRKNEMHERNGLSEDICNAVKQAIIEFPSRPIENLLDIATVRSGDLHVNRKELRRYFQSEYGLIITHVPQFTFDPSDISAFTEKVCFVNELKARSIDYREGCVFVSCTLLNCYVNLKRYSTKAYVKCWVASLANGYIMRMFERRCNEPDHLDTMDKHRLEYFVESAVKLSAFISGTTPIVVIDQMFLKNAPHLENVVSACMREVIIAPPGLPFLNPANEILPALNQYVDKSRLTKLDALLLRLEAAILAIPLARTKKFIQDSVDQLNANANEAPSSDTQQPSSANKERVSNIHSLVN